MFVFYHFRRANVKLITKFPLGQCAKPMLAKNSNVWLIGSGSDYAMHKTKQKRLYLDVQVDVAFGYGGWQEGLWQLADAGGSARHGDAQLPPDLVGGHIYRVHARMKRRYHVRVLFSRQVESL